MYGSGRQPLRLGGWVGGEENWAAQVVAHHAHWPITCANGAVHARAGPPHTQVELHMYWPISHIAWF